MQPVIVTSEKCWEYGQLGHPEGPDRVKRTYEFLYNKNFEFIKPGRCSDQDILRVHTKKLVNEIKSGNFFDADSPPLDNIYEYALLSASGAITAMECSFGSFVGPRKSDKKVALSLMRPPGHHATKNTFGGFCYFNNIAIAVKKLLNSSGVKVAILDIDCHHGNGTQDIFFGYENVLFVSLHQVPLYPGTGLTPEKNCLNFPLLQGTDSKKYIEIFKIALKEVEKYKPDLIAVSAGFDTYRGDPLTQLSLEKTTYKKIAELISSLNLPTFAVLEGGYSKDLPECIFNFMAGF